MATGNSMSARTSFPSIFLHRCAGVAPGASKNSVQSTVPAYAVRAESQEIRKERHGFGVYVQLVAVANLSVTVPIGSVDKLARPVLNEEPFARPDEVLGMCAAHLRIAAGQIH